MTQATIVVPVVSVVVSVTVTGGVTIWSKIIDATTSREDRQLRSLWRQRGASGKTRSTR